MSYLGVYLYVVLKSLSYLSSWVGFLEVLEVVNFLELGVLDDVGISIVGEIGFPSDIGGVVVSDSEELDAVVNGADGYFVSLDEFEADVMVKVGELADSVRPGGAVLVGNLDS